MVQLKDWYLSEYSPMHYLAWGGCFGHSRIQNGLLTHTSSIVTIDEDIPNERLIVHTRSGNEYELKFECICLSSNELENTEAILKEFNVCTDFLSKVEVLVANRKKMELSIADSLIKNGDLLLEVTANNVYLGYFKDKNRVYCIEPYCHSGMFQDSVLIKKAGVVDYRYFPYGCMMETYHISDNIKRLVIKNIGSTVVTLDKREYQPDTVTTVCITKDYYQEGLISPDLVNGKNVFTE